MWFIYYFIPYLFLPHAFFLQNMTWKTNKVARDLFAFRKYGTTLLSPLKFFLKIVTKSPPGCNFLIGRIISFISQEISLASHLWSTSISYSFLLSSAKYLLTVWYKPGSMYAHWHLLSQNVYAYIDLQKSCRTRTENLGHM